MSLILISGCSAIAENLTESKFEEPQVLKNLNTEFHNMPAPATGKAVVGIYSFSDKTVVERVGLDNLIKERQIIRSARLSVNDKRELKPMLFAGVLVEGGIIGYDSNVMTGGTGARYLGIGTSKEYRQDVVTITMRMVSVQSGEVLLSVSVTKTIISTGSSMTFFKFFDMGTKNAEVEMGYSINEPVNYAVRVAIEQSVVELIKEGERKGFWKFVK